MEDKKVFEYKYSASRQIEVENIRKKYLSPEEDKLVLLKRLDKDAEKPGTIISILLGLVGILTFGGGMSCTLVWPDTLLIPGIILFSIGIVLMALAYPMYYAITQKQRKKLAPKILALSEDLLK